MSKDRLTEQQQWNFDLFHAGAMYQEGFSLEQIESVLLGSKKARKRHVKLIMEWVRLLVEASDKVKEENLANASRA